MDQDNFRHLRLTNTQLEEALAKRKEFLDANPDMQEFQDEIDETLARAGKKLENREAALRGLFRSMAIELQIECLNAQDECEKILEIIKKCK